MRFAHARQGVLGLATGIVRLCYPPCCELCDADTSTEPCSNPRLCSRCVILVADGPESRSCWRCASTIGPFAGTVKGCDQCETERFAFERALRLGAYEGLLRTACLRLKGIGGYRIGHALTELLVERRREDLRALNADLVVSVPLHWSRRLMRGYDQSGNIADRIAQLLGIDVCHRALVRTRRTAHQASVTTFSERQANVRNAFRTRSNTKLSGATVLLVDDILTSGATCNQAARALKAGGAKHVYVAVLARGAAGRK